MGMGDVMFGKILELAGLQRIEHTNIAHRQNHRLLRRVTQQAGQPPARRVLMIRHLTVQPGRRAGNQQ